MELNTKKCVPCEGLSDPLKNEEEDKFLDEISGWSIDRVGEHKIRKEYKLPHFRDSMVFVNEIADLSENEGHHPNITILFNVVKIEIFTHAINGLSENDFILAAKIDEIFKTKTDV